MNSLPPYSQVLEGIRRLRPTDLGMVELNGKLGRLVVHERGDGFHDGGGKELAATKFMEWATQARNENRLLSIPIIQEDEYSHHSFVMPLWFSSERLYAFVAVFSVCESFDVEITESRLREVFQTCSATIRDR